MAVGGKEVIRGTKAWILTLDNPADEVLAGVEMINIVHGVIVLSRHLGGQNPPGKHPQNPAQNLAGC